MPAGQSGLWVLPWEAWTIIAATRRRLIAANKGVDCGPLTFRVGLLFPLNRALSTVRAKLCKPLCEQPRA
jgi:hypothetical protein